MTNFFYHSLELVQTWLAVLGDYLAFLPQYLARWLSERSALLGNLITFLPEYLTDNESISYIGGGIVLFIGFFVIFDKLFRPSILYFINHFIRYKLIKWLLFGVIIVSFVSSILSIKRYSLPLVDLEELQIRTVVPGWTAQEIEADVTIPIEQELAKVSGIKDYVSRSTDNLSYIDVKIDPNTQDIERVKEDVRTALDYITDFPETIEERPDIREVKSENFPSLSLGIVSEEASLLSLYEHIKRLKALIERVEGVASVREINLPSKEIHVLLDRDKLYERQVTFLEVGEAIRSSEKRLFAGKLESSRYVKNIQTEASYEAPEQIENMIVRATVSNNHSNDRARLLVGDVGSAKWELSSDLNTIMRFNGKVGFRLDVIKKVPVDVIDVLANVHGVIDSYETHYRNDDIEVIVFNDISLETRNQLSIAYKNLLVGLLLVLLTLLFFLGGAIAFWTTVGIGTSLAITIIFMNFLNISINRISLCGIIISLGILVDSAIIMAETIYKYKERGFLWKDAALMGTNDILKPLFMMEFTTIVAFACIFLIRGSVGTFSTHVPIVVICILIASLVESIILLPTHLGGLSDRRSQQSSMQVLFSSMVAIAMTRAVKPKWAKWAFWTSTLRDVWVRLYGVMQWLQQRILIGDKFIQRIKIYYIALLKRMIIYPYWMTLVLVILFGSASSWMVLRSSYESFPIMSAYRLEIAGELENRASLAYTAEEVAKVEAIIDEFPDGIVSNYQTIIGGRFDNQFEINIVLIQFEEREMDAVTVKDIIFDKIAERNIPVTTLTHFIDSGGPPTDGKQIKVSVIGNNDARRRVLVEGIMDDLADLVDLEDLEDLAEFGLTEVRSDLRVSREETKIVPIVKAYAAGVTPERLGDTLRSVFAGQIVTTVQNEDERVDIRMKLDRASLDYEDPLHNLLIRSRRGYYINIRDIVKTQEGTTLASIYRRNGERQNTIFANYDHKKATANQIYNALNLKYSGFAYDHPGFVLSVGGESEQSSRLLFDLIFGIIIMVILVYILLVLQFHSLLQPVIIVSVIPFSILGTAIIFYLHGYQLGLLSTLGMLGAGGLVVNVSLAMIEYMNRNIDRRTTLSQRNHNIVWSKVGTWSGLDKWRLAAILAGVRSRFRPIFLTTMTTLMGVVFTAYGTSSGSGTYIRPMTLALFWGVAWGMVSALFVVPVIYCVMLDIKVRFQEIYYYLLSRNNDNPQQHEVIQ